jgi:predicted transcriptional regulator of viral defense system
LRLAEKYSIFSARKGKEDMMVNVVDKVLNRIRGKGRGGVHTSKDFLDLGSRAAVDHALSRLASKGYIRRLSRGVYDYPKVTPKLGALTPSPDSVAKAVAKKTKSQLQVTGAYAANMLGLSTQVPARVVYLTNGNTKRVRVGNQTIELRHASPKKMATAGRPGGTVIQALSHIGCSNVDKDIIDRLKAILSDDDKADLRKCVDSAPDWMRPILLHIASAN